MKILALSDQESKYYYDCYEPGRLDDIDLIISCGDLEPGYLEFFATLSHAPVLYVHGNHDARYDANPPLGCICIDDSIFRFNGVRILGLGGSMRYSFDKPNQYNEKEMRARIRRLQPKLRRYKGFDILVTHAPAFELNDMPDLPHRGFRCFRDLMDRYHPAYFFHGHVHENYVSSFKRMDKYGDTVVVNAYEYCVVDAPWAVPDPLKW